MKKALFAFFFAAFVTSMCFAEEASAPSGTNDSANATQASGNATAPAQISNATVAPTQLPGTTAPAAETTGFAGKVDSVSSGSGISGAKPQVTVKDAKGQIAAFIVTTDTTIIGKDGDPTSLNWINRDDQVSIEYIANQDGTKTAKSIKLSSSW